MNEGEVNLATGCSNGKSADTLPTRHPVVTGGDTSNIGNRQHSPVFEVLAHQFEVLHHSSLRTPPPYTYETDTAVLAQAASLTNLLIPTLYRFGGMSPSKQREPI